MSISSYAETRNPLYLVNVQKDLNDEGDQIPPEAIARFEYDEDEKKVDMLKLTILDPYLTILDSGAVDPGNFIVFSFGHAGGAFRTVTHRIMGLEPDFTPNGHPQFILFSYDFGINLASSFRPTNYGKVSRSDVAQQIATRHGLDFFGDDSTVLKKDIMQPAAMSDMMFLQKLAYEINFVCFVAQKTLVFKKRNYDDAPTVELIYRNPDGQNTTGTLISFKPHMKLASRPAAIGLNDGANVTQADQSTSDQPSLSTKAFKYLVDGISGGVLQKVDAGAGVKKEPAPFGDPDRTKDVAQARADWNNQQNIKGTVEAIGDVGVSKARQIRLSGLGRRFSGNWHVESVKHVISAGNNYRMTINVHKDAPLGPSTSQVEDTTAKKTNDKPANATIGIEGISGNVVP